MMKIEELRKILIEQGFPEDSYRLLEDSANEALCLSRNYDSWSVFYSERGQRTEEELFHFEEEACQAFLARIKRMMGKTP